MHFKIGCIPYINAYPLIHYFQKESPPLPIELVFDVPAKLPSLLNKEIVDAVITSSFEAFKSREYTIATTSSISTFGAVTSVKIFSALPIPYIKRLALDQSSQTSNALAKILLAELYNIYPETELCPSNLDTNLKTFDACVIIGDPCLNINRTDLFELDLGQAWTSLTKLPFVWAVWISKGTFPRQLIHYLSSAKIWGQEHLEDVIQIAAKKSCLHEDKCRTYLKEIINYDFNENHLKGLKKYFELIQRYNLLKEGHFPKMIS